MTLNQESDGTFRIRWGSQTIVAFAVMILSGIGSVAWQGVEYFMRQPAQMQEVRDAIKSNADQISNLADLIKSAATHQVQQNDNVQRQLDQHSQELAEHARQITNLNAIVESAPGSRFQIPRRQLVYPK